MSNPELLNYVQMDYLRGQSRAVALLDERISGLDQDSNAQAWLLDASGFYEQFKIDSTDNAIVFLEVQGILVDYGIQTDDPDIIDVALPYTDMVTSWEALAKIGTQLITEPEKYHNITTERWLSWWRNAEADNLEGVDSGIVYPAILTSINTWLKLSLAAAERSGENTAIGEIMSEAYVMFAHAENQYISNSKTGVAYVDSLRRRNELDTIREDFAATCGEAGGWQYAKIMLDKPDQVLMYKAIAGELTVDEQHAQSIRKEAINFDLEPAEETAMGLAILAMAGKEDASTELLSHFFANRFLLYGEFSANSLYMRAIKKILPDVYRQLLSIRKYSSDLRSFSQLVELHTLGSDLGVYQTHRDYGKHCEGINVRGARKKAFELSLFGALAGDAFPHDFNISSEQSSEEFLANAKGLDAWLKEHRAKGITYKGILEHITIITSFHSSGDFVAEADAFMTILETLHGNKINDVDLVGLLVKRMHAQWIRVLVQKSKSDDMDSLRTRKNKLMSIKGLESVYERLADLDVLSVTKRLQFLPPL